MLEITAIGSDHVCEMPDDYAESGWRARQTITVRIRRRVSVYMAGSDDRPKRRPSIIYFGASQRIYGMRWTSWGRRVARGRGVFPANDCVPTCADGNISPQRVRVHLSRPTHCRGRGYRYLVLRMRVAGAADWSSPAKFGYLCGLGPNSP